MAEDKKQGFTVSDRRLFTEEGELRPDAEREKVQTETVAPAPEAPRKSESPPLAQSGTPEHTGAAEIPPPPTAEEQRASSSAYASAHAQVDSALDKELGAQHRPESLKATFDSFVASLYMSAMLQLGLLHERDEQPQVDLVGARHTIDTLAMLEEKTRGNLTDAEKALLQDCLFRLRMAFVEMTNAITRAPQNPPGGVARKK